MYIRDDTGRIAYLLGINQDITEFVMMHRLLDSLVNTGQEDAGSVEKITTSVSELLDDLLLEDVYKRQLSAYPFLDVPVRLV